MYKQPEITDGTTNYSIREKYCPTLRRNVPVMVFSDSKHTELCWESGRCGEDCFYKSGRY